MTPCAHNIRVVPNLFSKPIHSKSFHPIRSNFQFFPYSQMSVHQFTTDADSWKKGMTLIVYGERKVPHLPIDVDKLMFQTCSIDTLSLKGLLPNSLEHLVIIASRIRSITNIPPSLKYLSIQQTSLEALPELPPGLQTLRLIDVDGFETEVLSPLPPNLHFLSMSNVDIRLCEELPPRLVTLCCESMNLESLPSDLPATLNDLNCSGNRIRVLPDVLPPSLVRLNCSRNILESLPPLPSNLSFLCCSHNQLRELPSALPSRLRVLNCAQNQICILPSLPDWLRTLNFSNNPIETYPHVSEHVYVKISRDGEYFKALGTPKYVLRSGITVFPPSIDYVPFINDDAYASMMYTENNYEESDILDCVLEVQRQVMGRAFLKTIKEELIAATWHPRRVEAWCGVDFSDPDSD